MKKINILIFVFLCVMFLPIMANAKEKCTVVSGNKTDIGSEIACGSEHFYIVDSNENETKMLAKYNLDTGVTIHKEKLEEGQNCYELATSKDGTVKSDGFYEEDGYCFYFTVNAKKHIKNVTLNVDDNDARTPEEICREYAISDNGEYYDSYGYGKHVYCSYYYLFDDDYNMLQKEDAKSAHWDDNLNYLYPQVGDVYMVHVGYVASAAMNFEEGLTLSKELSAQLGEVKNKVEILKKQGAELKLENFEED